MSMNCNGRCGILVGIERATNGLQCNESLCKCGNLSTLQLGGSQHHLTAIYWNNSSLTTVVRLPSGIINSAPFFPSWLSGTSTLFTVWYEPSCVWLPQRLMHGIALIPQRLFGIY